MRYFIRNSNKIEFLKQLVEARKRGCKVIKIKTEMKTRTSTERDISTYRRYKKHETIEGCRYVALIEMSDKDA